MSAIIEFRGIRKSFPGVRALDDVSFSIDRGEIHAIVGENGAGKSTLMNILGGRYHPDAGEIVFDGSRVRIQSEFEALKLGIGVVYQELRLCPNLTITENLFLGREREIGEGRVRWPMMEKAAGGILGELGSEIDPRTVVGKLSLANQQLVEIARAMSMDASVIVMDEPTSALSLRETDGLFRNIARLREKGVTIIYISHRLEEVFAIADRISVLRDGKHLGTYRTAEVTQQQIVTLIAGRELAQTIADGGTRPRPTGGRTPALEVRHLSRPGCFTDVSFTLYEREILGIYGLQGSGRTEILETLFGLAPSWSGEVVLFGKTVANRSPREAIRHGIAMIPENRRDAGIFPEMDVVENINTANPRDMSGALGVLRTRFMRRTAEEFVRSFNIKTSSATKQVRNLSGGNQQKVVISKWLATHPRILLIDELTRGIDVGAKAEIYRILKDLRNDGLSVLMVSSELAEILSESDRIVVIRGGALAAVLEGGEMTKEKVIQHALQGR
ncbi:MAG TPA: sugar ABC transporter ATP-binding protein [Spirochaetia bacterium]